MTSNRLDENPLHNALVAICIQDTHIQWVISQGNTVLRIKAVPLLFQSILQPPNICVEALSIITNDFFSPL